MNVNRWIVQDACHNKDYKNLNERKWLIVLSCLKSRIFYQRYVHVRAALSIIIATVHIRKVRTPVIIYINHLVFLNFPSPFTILIFYKLLSQARQKSHDFAAILFFKIKLHNVWTSVAYGLKAKKKKNQNKFSEIPNILTFFLFIQTFRKCLLDWKQHKHPTSLYFERSYPQTEVNWRCLDVCTALSLSSRYHW